MDYWYEGNLNENANRREKDGIVYYIRGVRKVNGLVFAVAEFPGCCKCSL